MAYMVYQQYTNAIVDAYAGHSDVARHHEAATVHRAWLESLDIDPAVKGTLVEQARTVEAAFAHLLRRSRQG
jgi:hypothetical protein